MQNRHVFAFKPLWRSVWLLCLFLLGLFLSACAETDTKQDTNSDSRPTVVAPNNYEAARRVFWQQLYPKGGRTLYCEKAFSDRRQSKVNIEHVFPMSWVTRALKCGKRKQCRDNSRLFNQIEADLHNLYPSLTQTNYDRSSFRFAELDGEPRAYGKSCDFEVDPRRRAVEPPPESRGDVARAMFYMAHSYADAGLELFEKQARLLARWHREDPPSEHERLRNQKIEAAQGNRNPFIDEPGRVDTVLRAWY